MNIELPALMLHTRPGTKKADPQRELAYNSGIGGVRLK
jgi:hypothetical protein